MQPGHNGRWPSSTPLGRVGRPDEVADTVVYLLSDNASFVTATVIPIGGDRAARVPDPDSEQA